MQYQLLANNDSVQCVDTGAFIPAAPGNRDWDAYQDWLAAGNTPLPVPLPPAPSLSELTLIIQTGVQAWMDATAQSKGYDNALSCVSYVNSPNTTFQSEANSMLHWRDAVWSQCYLLQAEWTANTPNPLPTVDSVIAQLPQANQFGWT
jgi:hypothetical protein